MKIDLGIIRSFIFFITILFTSCKKNNTDPPSPGGSTLEKEISTDISTGSISMLFYRYNSSGDLVSIGGINGGDSLIYSSPGQLVEYRAGNFWKAKMIYDSTDRIIKKTGQSQDGFTWTTSYAYDNLNRIIADSSYDVDKVNKYNTYFYDNDNNITSYQQFYKFNSDTFVAQGEVIVTYDHKINPHAKFGKQVYYGDGDFRHLFKENIISEISGGLDYALFPKPVYKYYNNDLLWKASNTNTQIEYFFKHP